MLDLFAQVSERQRSEGLCAYTAYLAARDGTPDFICGTLARREATMERLLATPLRWRGRMDAALFRDQYENFDARRATSREMLLLLTFLKTNANEAYAVEQSLAHPDSISPAVDAIERLMLLEERYHTRLLQSAGLLFDVQVAGTVPPATTTRWLVAGIVRLPATLARPLTLAAEAVGILTIVGLLRAAADVFRSDPAIRDALCERAMEVLTDEIGHLCFNRLMLGRAGMLAARALLPLVALGTHGALAEAEELGILPLTLSEVGRFELRNLPAEALRHAFVA